MAKVNINKLWVVYKNSKMMLLSDGNKQYNCYNLNPECFSVDQLVKQIEGRISKSLLKRFDLIIDNFTL